MANKTRQVQRDHRRVIHFVKFGLKLKETTSRRYPCENEGQHLATYLNSLSASPTKLKPVLKMLRLLQKARTNRVEALDDYAHRAVLAAMRQCSWAFDMQASGFMFYPITPEGRAAHSFLVLYANRRIKRVRQCHHCKTWFYARFKHQLFCPNAKKKCQWHHYHTPEWRKKHRERTKRLQKEYRERIFGKAKLKLVGHK